MGFPTQFSGTCIYFQGTIHGQKCRFESWLSHCVVFLGKSLSPVPLSTLEYKSVQETVEETQQNTEGVTHGGLEFHPGRGAILLVASYIGKWMTSSWMYLCKFIDSRKNDPAYNRWPFILRGSLTAQGIVFKFKMVPFLVLGWSAKLRRTTTYWKETFW